MPVVTPKRGAASMLTVKAVRMASVLSSHLRREAQLVAPLAGEGEADHAPARRA